MTNYFQLDTIHCPHCGDMWDERDSAELGNDLEDSDRERCNECGESFRWHREFQLMYTTNKIGEGNA